MHVTKGGLKIRRALLTVSDKDNIIALGQCFQKLGVELVATGRTAQVLLDAGLEVIPIEQISGSPESFQGRMKTLSFPVCSGILYRRGDVKDEKDLEKLGIKPIDCVVVNFYPFEAAASKTGISRKELIEEIDIGGPTLVRAAAKNSENVLVLTSPTQYSQVIQELEENGQVQASTLDTCALSAWELIVKYDSCIARELGERSKKTLRYGENPHQKGYLEFEADSPIGWGSVLTSAELSYNNILDFSAAYALASDLIQLCPDSTGVVIVKHGNPCGVSLVPRSHSNAQKLALTRAWEGDPTSAFGGVLVFTDPIQDEAASWLSQHFVELVGAPGLTQESSGLKILLAKRKNLKAVPVLRFGGVPKQSQVAIPGGLLFQTTDVDTEENLKSVTEMSWPQEKALLARFGILVCKSLKSNAIAIVRELHTSSGILQLVGAGQGQPNRIEALQSLAVPRAQSVLRTSEGSLGDCVMVSDAFFPFRDTVDRAYAAGIRFIVQPGGSLKDGESIQAANEHGISMVFTGVRHFKH